MDRSTDILEGDLEWPWRTLLVSGPWSAAASETFRDEGCAAVIWKPGRARVADIDAVAGLTNLQALRASVGSSNPSAFSRCAELRLLDLKTSWRGDVDLSALRGLISLTYVNGKPPSGLSGLSMLRSLSLVDVGSDGLRNLELPSGVESLSISVEKPSLPIKLQPLTVGRLRFLDVLGAPVADIQRILSSFTEHIERVWLRNIDHSPDVSVDLSEASRLLKLEYLTIMNQGRVRGLSGLTSLPSLRFAELTPVVEKDLVVAPHGLSWDIDNGGDRWIARDFSGPRGLAPKSIELELG